MDHPELCEACFTPKERQVVEAMLNDTSNKGIASLTGQSERTIRYHVSNLLDKFGVERRVEILLSLLHRNVHEVVIHSQKAPTVTNGHNKKLRKVC